MKCYIVGAPQSFDNQHVYGLDGIPTTMFRLNVSLTSPNTHIDIALAFRFESQPGSRFSERAKCGS